MGGRPRRRQNLLNPVLKGRVVLPPAITFPFNITKKTTRPRTSSGAGPRTRIQPWVVWTPDMTLDAGMPPGRVLSRTVARSPLMRRVHTRMRMSSRLACQGYGNPLRFSNVVKIFLFEDKNISSICSYSCQKTTI